MGAVVLWISALILAGTVGLSAYGLRDLKPDRYELGGWKPSEGFRGSGLSTDVRTIIIRLEGSLASPQSWHGLLGRLDDLHEQLSPFGENARRPAVEYRTWWGATRVMHQTPAVYNRRYLETYIATLEKLAGVHADER